MWLGLEGFGAFLAFISCFIATIICVVYGIVNWNKPKEDIEEEIKEEIKWEQHDPELSNGGKK
ncbi:MAG: symporter small accessory protein [Brevinematia bacterium]